MATKVSDNMLKDGVAIPPGAVMSFAMSAAPVGWLACDGSAVSRTQYAGLFAAVGTIYGIGNNSTTFNVPNLQGQFVRGLTTNLSTTSKDPLSASRVLGNVQGDAMLNHLHTFSGTTGNDSPDHTHNYLYAGQQIPRGGGGSGTFWESNQVIGSGGANQRHQHSFSGTTNNPNVGGSTETRPVNIALLYCIKY